MGSVSLNNSGFSIFIPLNAQCVQPGTCITQAIIGQSQSESMPCLLRSAIAGSVTNWLLRGKCKPMKNTKENNTNIKEHDIVDTDEASHPDLDRRHAIKKMGVFAAFTSIGMKTLLLSRKAIAGSA